MEMIMSISKLAKRIVSLMGFGKMHKASKAFDAFVKHTNELLLEAQETEDKQETIKIINTKGKARQWTN
jgi:hypothetical protein